MGKIGVGELMCAAYSAGAQAHLETLAAEAGPSVQEDLLRPRSEWLSSDTPNVMSAAVFGGSLALGVRGIQHMPEHAAVAPVFEDLPEPGANVTRLY